LLVIEKFFFLTSFCLAGENSASISATSQTGETLGDIIKEHISMKRIFTILLLALFSKLSSQTILEINKGLSISDSLSYQKEIRIYKRYSITNASEIFRIFLTDDKVWKVELYKYYNAVDKNDKSRFELQSLKTNTNLRLVWLYFLETNIEVLPSIEQIRYKLRGKAEYELYNGEYEVSHREVRPLDGIGYEAFVKDGNYKHHVEFGNYDSYLRHYPNIDELNFYSEIISIIQKEFNIWKS